MKGAEISGGDHNSQIHNSRCSATATRLSFTVVCFNGHTTYNFITWSIFARQTGHPHFLALTSFKQDMQPAICPHGIKAPSTGASKQITHEVEELSPFLISFWLQGRPKGEPYSHSCFGRERGRKMVRFSGKELEFPMFIRILEVGAPWRLQLRAGFWCTFLFSFSISFTAGFSSSSSFRAFNNF